MYIVKTCYKPDYSCHFPFIFKQKLLYVIGYKVKKNNEIKKSLEYYKYMN